MSEQQREDALDRKLSGQNKADRLIDGAAALIAGQAYELMLSHSIEGEWPESEAHVKAEHDMLLEMVGELRELKGNCQGILDRSACEVSITPEMIEAGAQRLLAWEDDSPWPDSWDSMAVAAARNDAERVLRSALNARADHIADASKMVKGDVYTAGSVILPAGKTHERAIVVAFQSDDDLRAAIAAGQCRFTVFGGDV
ncbi:hypothetical protein HLV39_12225 [Marinobacter adhaerens]|uniref:Uncharacterized protein n=1 Tax=Marinobacter adhaerens TaxID=1033846 RepID=A0A851HRA5_9GAMM|nr:hypothetical protein [Marinobacter adhaerens]NWN92259.1 hypothetical protein [Marinobacter adhaerens]